jgi:hypothetical protein
MDGHGGKEQVMGGTRTRVAVALSATIAVVTAVAGTAGARIPEGDAFGGGAQAQPTLVSVPDAVERAVQVRARTLTGTSASDVVTRAIARHAR